MDFTSDRLRLVSTGLVCVVVMLTSAGALAQSPNAGISGTVTDTSGAVIPDVQITITDVNKGITQTTTTNHDGIYRFTSLLPGTYRESLSKAGFKTETRDGIDLRTGDEVTLNFPLSAGAATETVTVEAGAPLIETQNTDLGEVIAGRRVEDTPVNGRNPMALLALVPGVIPQGASNGQPAAASQGVGFLGPSGFGNFQISGSLAGWLGTYVDGAPVNVDMTQNWQALVPTQDSVAAFKVEQNAVNPSYGRFGGGVVSFDTKSGTNRFHGTAYEFIRNTVLDANDFITNSVGGPRTVLQQNQYGGAVGGPIIKDKTFFFVNYEGLRIATAGSTNILSPDAANYLAGNFQNFPGANNTSCSTAFFDPASGGTACYNGVPNTVDPANYNSTSLALVKLNYVHPCTVSCNGQPLVSGLYNAIGTTHTHNNSYQAVARLDQQLSEKQRLFARYNYWNVDIPTPTGFLGSPLVGGVPSPTSSTHSVVLGDTYLFSPTLTGDFRIAYLRYKYDIGVAPGANLSDLGSGWAAVGGQLPIQAWPTIFPPGFATWPNGPLLLNDLQLSTFNTYTLSASLTKVVGKHTLQFGGEARRLETYFLASIEPSGNFLFTGSNAMINFLEGAVSNNVAPSLGNITVPAQNPSYSYYQGYYINDTFQVKPRLTANLGLRYELPGEWLSRHDNNSVILPNADNPLGGFINPVSGGTQNLVGTLAAVNSPQYHPRGSSNSQWLLFEPRVGMVAQIAPRTVARAGFGITHPCLDCGGPGSAPFFNPLSSAVTVNSSSFSDPYPGGVNLPLGHNTQIMEPYSQFPRTLLGTSITAQDPNYTYTYYMQWNANLQHQLGSSAAFSIAYAGSRGLHIGTQNVNLGQLPDRYDSLGPALQTPVANPFYGVVSPTSPLGSSPTYASGQFLSPYPQFQYFYSANDHVGFSNYSALLATAQKRFGSGASINFVYQWAHFLTNEDSANGFIEPGQTQTGPGPQDYTNLKADYSNSTNDVRQRMNINYVYDLPVGRGQKFFANAGSVANGLIGGWNLSGITTFQSGNPVPVYYGPGNALQQFGAGTIRPNVVPGCSKTFNTAGKKRLGEWFNTACFAPPGNYSFGNEPRVDNSIRAAGIDNFDLAAVKTTPLKGEVSLMFRAEFFNLFNHPQFGPPSGEMAGGSFGVVTTQVNQPRIGQLALRVSF